MIRETIIDAEPEESDEAHDLKLLNVLMKCIEEAIEEGNLFEDDEDDDVNDDCVCLCDPTDIEAGYCCCSARGKKCNGKCRPDGTTGGSSHDHHTFIVSYGGNKSFSPKKGTRIQTE